MKWIGQHIWDLTSRFRNDVYFEGLAETAETRGLVVDANGKVSINPLSGDEHATHIYENVRNDEGSTIPVGTPVYSKGEIGGSERIKVGIADASDPAKMPAIGITNTELTTTGNTKDGLITLVGVYNTNLSGFSGVSENDIVYVAIGGGLTITKPTGANLIQNVGIVLKTNGPGTIIQGLQVTCIGRTNDVPTPLYIDHANQRLGIGTTSPDQTLHVIGDARIQGNLTVNGTYTQIDTDVTTTEQWLVTNDGTGPAAVINQKGSEDIFDVQDDGTSVFYIEDGGQIGIGTTSPTARLHVESADDVVVRLKSTDNKAYIALSDNDTNGYISSENGKLSLGANTGVNANNLNIDLSNNRVGIGTSSPSEMLEVTGYAKASTGFRAGNYTILSESGNETSLSNSAYYPMFFKTNNSVRMTISNAGNVGIGTTSPGAKLHTIPSGSIGWSSLGNAGILIGTDTGAGIGIDQNEIASKGDHLYLGTVTTDKDLILRAGGATNRLVVKGDTGRVGIGTSSPEEELSVVGSIQLTNQQQIVWSDVGDGNNGRVAIKGDEDNDFILLKTDNSERMRLTNTGVGINTTSPSEKLEVNGNIKVGDGNEARFGADNDLRIYHNGTNSNIENFTGTLQIVQTVDDDDITFRCDDGSGGTTPYLTIDGSAEQTRFFKDTRHTDGIKANFGNSDDLRIYHDATNSYIHNETGNLYILNKSDDKDIVLQSDDGSGGLATYLTIDGSAVANKFSEKVQIYKLDATANPRLSLGRHEAESINFDVEDRTARIYHKQDETTGNHVLKLTLDSDTSDTKDIHLGFRDADGSNESIKFTVDESGNVGVGTTDPSEKLHIVGDLKVATNADAGVIHFGDTSDETKIVGYDSSDSNTRFDFFTSGSKKLTILDSGNVGIGTDSPSANLEIGSDGAGEKTLKIHSDTANSYFEIESLGNIARLKATNNTNLMLRSDGGGGYITNWTNGAERMRITSAGNVGIGINNPAYVLDTHSGTTNVAARFKSGDNQAWISVQDDDSGTYGALFGTDSDAGHDIILADSSANKRLVINGSGHVGIGTTSPDSLLHVSADVSSGGVTNTGTITIEGRPAGYLGDDIATIDFHNTGVKYADIRMERGNAANDSQLVFSTSDTGTLNDALIINEVGNVGIGTTTPSEKLEVDGKILATGGQIRAGSYLESYPSFSFADDIDTGMFSDTANQLEFVTGGSSRVTINSVGNVGIGTTSPVNKLDVGGDLSAASIRIGSSASGEGIIRHNAGSGNGVGIVTGSLNSSSIGLFVDHSANNRNVGIGTTSPGDKLQVSGNIKIEDNNELRVGTGNDLRFTHTGTGSYIDNYTGNLSIRNFADDSDILFQSDDGSGGVTTYLAIDGSTNRVNFNKPIKIVDSTAINIGSGLDLRLTHDGTDSLIQNFEGNLEIQQRADDKDIILMSDDGSGGQTAYLTLDGGDESIKFYKDISNQANANLVMGGGQIKFSDSGRFFAGDSNDLQIYHDGSHSYIRDVGSGVLKIGGNQVHIGNPTVGEVYFKGFQDAQVELYYDNSKKLETTSTGVEVTGNISLTGSVQKQIQVFPMNFVDDLGTDKHFMPFVTANEQTANYQEEACMVMPADGRVVSVTVHYAQMHGAASDITVGIETSPCGQSYTNAWTIEETETISASADDDHHVFHFAFDNAKHFESTDKMALSIQQSVDLQNANRFFWVTAVIEYDWSTFLGGTSAEYTTTP